MFVTHFELTTLRPFTYPFACGPKINVPISISFHVLEREITRRRTRRFSRGAGDYGEIICERVARRSSPASRPTPRRPGRSRFSGFLTQTGGLRTIHTVGSSRRRPAGRHSTRREGWARATGSASYCPTELIFTLPSWGRFAVVSFRRSLRPPLPNLPSRSFFA